MKTNPPPFPLLIEAFSQKSFEVLPALQKELFLQSESFLTGIH